MKKIIFIFLFIFCYSAILPAAGKRVLIDSVIIKSGVLTVNFSTEGIIDQKVAEGLVKGLTSTIEYQIQLWEKKSGWINNLVTQNDVRIKVYFDNWENKYVFMSEQEKRLTTSIETIRKKCSFIQNVDLYNAAQMSKNSEYFITIKVILRPMSVENYQEIKKWLSGKAKNFDLKKLGDTEKQEKRVKGGIFKMFMALTGFGDRIISGKCNNFKVDNNKIIW